MAYPYANRYLDQFPKDKMNQAFRFGAFIPGALAAILGVITMWDPDLFLGFEISGRTALFWLGILGTIFVTCRNAASDEDDEVWDPEFAMKSVIGYTHYCPESWQGRLHSDEVRQEFSSLYQLEALLFLDDIAGAILTPFILMWSLTNCADQLVDFFREFTIHVDGLGTVCSFAVFDFRSGGKAAPRPGQRPGDLRDDYYGDKANKLMESYYSFLDHYGPNPKRGLQGRLNKRPFHPPPTFPGMIGSPSVMAENPSVVARHAAGPSLLRQSTIHTPRFGPAPGHSSPMHSILLDPHHQPRSSPRQGPSMRPVRTGVASSRHPLDANPIEAEESQEPAAATGTIRMSEQRTSSGLIDEDSELGDSWLLRGGVPPDEDAARREAEMNGAGHGAGVLGMLFELQKAQKESRGGHI
jgi:autophagy-related protein 9